MEKKNSAPFYIFSNIRQICIKLKWKIFYIQKLNILLFDAVPQIQQFTLNISFDIDFIHFLYFTSILKTKIFIQFSHYYLFKEKFFQILQNEEQVYKKEFSGGFGLVQLLNFANTSTIFIIIY